jgi:hypothetical protein
MKFESCMDVDDVAHAVRLSGEGIAFGFEEGAATPTTAASEPALIVCSIGPAAKNSQR